MCDVQCNNNKVARGKALCRHTPQILRTSIFIKKKEGWGGPTSRCWNVKSGGCGADQIKAVDERVEAWCAVSKCAHRPRRCCCCCCCRCCCDDDYMPRARATRVECESRSRIKYNVPESASLRMPDKWRALSRVARKKWLLAPNFSEIYTEQPTRDEGGLAFIWWREIHSVCVLRAGARSNNNKSVRFPSVYKFFWYISINLKFLKELGKSAINTREFLYYENRLTTTSHCARCKSAHYYRVED